MRPLSRSDPLNLLPTTGKLPTARYLKPDKQLTSSTTMKLPHQWGKRTRGIDIPKRLKKLNISVLDFQNKSKEAPKVSKNTNSAKPTKEKSLKIPQDIASSILFQSTDFLTLKCLILVNKCFLGAFQSYRVSILHVVAQNMFGIDTVDYALVLAGFMDRPASLLSAEKTVVMVTPNRRAELPPGIIKKAQFIHDVVSKWVKLYEMKQLWLNVPKKKGRSKASDVAVQNLSSTESARLYHALVIYWLYSFCANYIDKRKPSPYMSSDVDKLGLCGYFSNIGLVQIMAVFSFFFKVLSEACEDYQISGDDDFLYWEGYCLSQDPFWFLRLLEDYSAAFVGTYCGRHEGFGLYDMLSEGKARKFEVGFGSEGDLSDAGHQALLEQWAIEGIDSNFRPSRASKDTTLD